MPIWCFVSSLTIRKWTKFVRLKKGKYHSCKKEPWKLSRCNGNITVCFTERYVTSGVELQLQCLNISREILDFVIGLHTVTTCDVVTCVLLTWLSLKRGVFLQVPEHIVLLLFVRHCNLLLFWSWIVFCLLFLLFYVIRDPVLAEGNLFLVMSLFNHTVI